VFVCRSGNRSARAARLLRRLGHAQAWHVAGGLALAG
jgi:rhodanese-related sulfurtransferase